MEMPPMMYGTAWKKERTEDLVYEALKAGFRSFFRYYMRICAICRLLGAKAPPSMSVLRFLYLYSSGDMDLGFLVASKSLFVL